MYGVNYYLLSTLTYEKNSLTKSPNMLFENSCFLFIYVFRKDILHKNVSGI